MVIADNLVNVMETISLLKLGDMAGSIATGNMVSAAVNLVGLFAKKPDPAGERHKQIMAALEKLSKQISELKKEMHERFDRVDKKLDIVLDRLDQIQGDVTDIKNRLDQIAAALGHLQDNQMIIQEDLFRNTHGGILQGCYTQATTWTKNGYDTSNLVSCKSGLVNLATSYAANYNFTGRARKSALRDFANELQNRGMEGSINMVRNITSRGILDFETPVTSGESLVNPEIMKMIMDKYLVLLGTHGITEVDKVNIRNIKSTLQALQDESARLADIRENSLFDLSLKLYETKRQKFLEELDRELRKFEEQKTKEISLLSASQPHDAAMVGISLQKPLLTSDKEEDVVNAGLKNWIISKKEEVVSSSSDDLNRGIIKVFAKKDLVYKSFDTKAQFIVPSLKFD